MMNPSPYEIRPDLPEALYALRQLALDLRWSWNHTADCLWQRMDATLWQHTRNPWLILQSVSLARLQELAADEEFLALLEKLHQEQKQLQNQTSWFKQHYPQDNAPAVAYFCMEYGITEALPLYSGGLGVLAGDHLKTCSELGVPLVAVGLLYQQGYFRQALSTDGEQLAFYPFNDPTQMPVLPVRTAEGAWLQVNLELPGRELRLRAWQVRLGAVLLYLLDSNDPLNDPADRGITSELYGGGAERRLQQEMVLGIGGYRLLKMLGKAPWVCHLNEGHAAFAVLEKARAFMQQEAVDFHTALVTTRAGNLFTTHTPVAAGFDCFPPDLITHYLGSWARSVGLDNEALLALGRSNERDPNACFNMATLAMRGCVAVNAVSRLHAQVSRRLFQPLFPRWPRWEVPVDFITNGVHVPSWDAPESDRLWTARCGKNRWRNDLEQIGQKFAQIDDNSLWQMRMQNRMRLIQWINSGRARCCPQAGVLDPNILTVGFARRFATYKRPNLLLQDKPRLHRLLTHPNHPVQLLLAGKAHPRDRAGQTMIREWLDFIHEYHLHDRVVFLVDYDLLTASYLTSGVDLWLNTPRRPWEACGTSGMKVLVNGGLNLSELDGWWAEAWKPELGWALGDGQEHGDDPQWDWQEAQSLYALLETQVIPQFYQRNEQGIPEQWVSKMRASMSQLTPYYSTNRMLRQYVQRYYRPLADAFVRRTRNQARIGRELAKWEKRIQRGWAHLRLGALAITQEGEHYHFKVQVYLGTLKTDDIRVQLYADAFDAYPQETHSLAYRGPLEGALNAHRYALSIDAKRPLAHYSIRIVPWHEAARLPLEAPFILWQG